MSESGWRVLVWRLGLCGDVDVDVLLVGCLSRERERSRWIRWLMRRCCGGGGVGTYMGVKGGVERKLLAAEAAGSIR